MNQKLSLIILLSILCSFNSAIKLASGDEIKFRTQEISNRLGVGYAVRLLDLNQDRRLDIVVVDRERVVWFENPTWKMHTLIEKQTIKDNVCFAPYDIDGDGKLDFALGADWLHSTDKGGTLQWISKGKKSKQKLWAVHPIGTEPTIHRIRWADMDGDGKKELLVVPLFGKGTRGPTYHTRGIRILSYKVPKNPIKGPWKAEVINDELHVAHNFIPVDIDDDGKLELLVASYEGVSLIERKANKKWSRVLIGTGNQKTKPKTGASEVKLGRLRGNQKYIATIEPWHGFQVAVYLPPDDGNLKQLWKRTVIDGDLKWGHAVWCANLDADKDQELIIGIRDNKDKKTLSGIRIYDPNGSDPAKWKRYLIDSGGVAVEDLAVGDLNGDGKLDIVAVGRATHNVRIYWNTGKSSGK